MSEADRAQEVELNEWERINSSRAPIPTFTPKQPGYGPEFCVVESCGEKMPAARRAYGFKICVACKEEQEIRERHLRR